MSGPFEDIAALDRVVHDPVRLALLTALEACKSADFSFLAHLLGLTNGNASTHLGRLEQAGLIEVEKTFNGKTPRTLYRLTRLGRTSLRRHWQQLEALRQAAKSLAPNPD
jgi:DNA-binding MarR family transcriptional regulator